MPELAVGVDEFTLVLRSAGALETIDWLDELDKMIDEFTRLSKIEELYGKLENATSKLQAGYTNGLTIVNRPWHFMICWHEILPTMGLCIKFSAHAYAAYCQDYEKKYQVKMNIVVFLKQIESDIYTMRLSRIDLTADYKDYPNPRNPTRQLDPNTLYEQIKSGNYIIRNHNDKKVIRTYSALDKNGAYETFYAGSRKGKTDGFLRCYDKKQEQIETYGYRYDEAIKCESWVRFEAVFKGTYAHQITEQLQKIIAEDEASTEDETSTEDEVSTEDKLKKLIAKDISDKYRFFDISTGDYLEITNDLVGLAAGTAAGKLSCSGTRDNSIMRSIEYLKKNSGLYMIFYKVNIVWGAEGEEKLLKHLKEVYEREYKPTADKKPEIKNWRKNNRKELMGTRLEDNFYYKQELPEDTPPAQGAEEEAGTDGGDPK